MNSSTSNLIKYVNGTSAKQLVAPEIDTANNVVDFTKYGSNIKSITTSGGKTIGYYTDNNGVVQLTELDSTSTSPVNTKTALKIVESENGYKFQGIKETTEGLTGSTILSGVLGGVSIATALNQVGIHIGHTFYGDDPTKWPQLLQDQKLLADTVNAWNCNFENAMVQGLLDASRNNVSGLNRSGILSDNVLNQGVLPLLYDISTNQAYAPEEMITDILGAIANAWQLNESTYEGYKIPLLYQPFDISTYSITYEGQGTKPIYFVSKHAENTDRYQLFIVSEESQAVTYTTSEGTTGTLYVDDARTYDGHTCYFKSVGQLAHEYPSITPYVQTTVETNTLTNQECIGAIYGEYTLPEGVEKGIGETTLGIGDFMKLERATTQTEKHNFLRDKFPSWFSNAIESFYIDPDTYEKVGQWLWPFSPTGVYEEVNSPTSSPWDMPLTENVPQSADGKAPLDQIENVLENVIDAMKGIVFNFDYDFDPVIGIPNLKPSDDTKKPPQDNDPVDKPKRTGDGSTPLIVVPTVSGDTGLGGVYNCTSAELGAINQYLWSSSFWTIVEKMITNPMDAIIGLHQVYFTPTHAVAKSDVYCGCQNTYVQSYKVTQRFYELDCGHVKIQEHFANVYDYEGTEISIYLPYVGIVPLDIDNVMRGEISIKYNIDICSGCGVCNISVSRDGYDAILYSYGCNVASVYPLSGRDFTGLINAVVNTGIGVGTGNTVHAISGAIGIVGNSKGQVQKSGGYGGNTGALGIKKPYLIISRCIPNNPSKYNLYRGYPTNQTLSLSNCKGYTEIENIRLDTTDMLYEDIEEITRLLNNGVIL